VRAAVRKLMHAAGSQGQAWSIIWVAGVAVTSTAREGLDRELDEFSCFLDVLASEIDDAPDSGSLFLVSSAGGVYGGSDDPPFTENTPTVPISLYGAFKLEMESAARRFSDASGIPLLIGRVTNLYGPGQKLEKMQGLISHLVLAHFRRKPVFIYVPLETVRDYVYVDDCAKLILDGLSRLQVEARRGPLAVTKILGSGQEVSISSLLGSVRAIGKLPPRVILGTSDAGKGQAVDLRMRSLVWPDLDKREKTPIAAGLHAVILDVLRTIQL
jgi:UDP-glucose 4-epimerase